MRNSSFYISWISFLLIACHSVDEKKTNILFVISDDQSYPHAGIYGTEWINTPGFDRVARGRVIIHPGLHHQCQMLTLTIFNIDW